MGSPDGSPITVHLMIPMLTGLAAGGLHVVSGADHLAALAPLAIQTEGKAARTGAFWGLGHGIGVVLIGGVGLWLRGFVNVESWSRWAEFGVGFLLLGLGGWAFRRARLTEIHIHPHDHNEGDQKHAHLHAHPARSRRHDHVAVGVGTLHGIAGSGHLYGVIPALALPTRDAIIYLIAFLVAAAGGMSAFAHVLGTVGRKGGPGAIRNLMYASAGLAVVVGLVWIVESWPA